MKKLIAVVDDEPDILELISVNLEKSNFKPKTFETAEDFFKFMENQIPDLIILDLMLPDYDGFEICKILKTEKNYSKIPILILSAKSEEYDRILGLEIGADDYVTKPFSPRELIARVKAILRRIEKKENSDILDIDNILKIDLKKFSVFIGEEKIDLTTTEFKILKILAEKRGWVFSREQLLQNLWGNDKIVLDRTIDVHIKNLREKLKEAGKLIKNIRGIGYKLEE